jgi:transposase InsO family protein
MDERDQQRKLFNNKLQEWEHFYKFDRPHGALGDRPPTNRLVRSTSSAVAGVTTVPSRAHSFLT